jgi:hypothetical protein
MAKQPKDSCDAVLDDIDFRFRGAGIYGDHFYNQFYLDADGCFHKDDGPAFIDGEGNKLWFRHGLRHRDGDEPAYIAKDGDKAWYKDGELHREGKPAVEYANGTVEWWIDGIQMTAGEVSKYKEALLKEEWRKAAEEIVAEMHEGLKQNIRVMTLPKFKL